MNLNSARKVLLATHIASITHEYRANALLLESPPGVGKSDTGFQYAEEMAKAINEPVGIHPFMLATITSVDVRGFMLPVKGVSGLDTVFSTPPWYPTLANIHVVMPDGTWHRPGKSPLTEIPRVGVLMLDELGQAEDDVKKAAAELLLNGRVGTVELPIGWRVTAAQNRLSDRSGVLRELMFLVNRRCLVKIEPAPAPWLEWVNGLLPAQRPHFTTISFAQRQPDLVFREEVPAGTEPFCTPRSLVLMDRDLRALRTPEDIKRDKLPWDEVAREVARGWIGEGTAAQFGSHLRYADELPDFDDIVKDPKKAKCPTTRDAQMVAAYMLAHNVDAKSADSVLAYINRLHREMQVLAVTTINAQQARAKTIGTTQAYVNWLVANKDLLVASRG